MPLSSYFGGKGSEVMSNMKESYKDPKKAKQVFYATANKRKNKGKRPTDPSDNFMKSKGL